MTLQPILADLPTFIPGRLPVAGPAPSLLRRTGLSIPSCRLPCNQTDPRFARFPRFPRIWKFEVWQVCEVSEVCARPSASSRSAGLTSHRRVGRPPLDEERMTCSRRMPAFRQSRDHLIGLGRICRVAQRLAPDLLARHLGPAGVRQPARHATCAALAIRRRQGAIEDGAGMRPEISGPQGNGILDLLTADMAGWTVDRGAARPGEQCEASGQPDHRAGAFPSQPASSPPVSRISTWRPARKPPELSSAPSSKRSDSGSSGVPAAPAMRRSILNASPWARMALSQRTVRRRIGP